MPALALSSGDATLAGVSALDAWSRIEEIRAPTTLAWGHLDLPMVVARCRTLANRRKLVREAVGLA